MPVLKFRPTAVTDAIALLRAVNANAAFLSPWVTTPKRVTDLGAAQDLVTEVLPNGMPARYGVFLGESLTASAKLVLNESDVPDYEIGLWCVQDWVGRGVGRWILSNAIDRAFSIGANRVTLRHAVSNSASGKLMGRVGATLEGVLRDATRIRDRLDGVVLYGILREDWPTTQALGWCEPCREF